MVEVTNLATGATKGYTCTPREAVIAAYAQERKDWNTWQYEARYGHLVTAGSRTVGCGDWVALTS